MAEILDRSQHEQSFARRLGSLSGRHRRELQEFLGHPPDISRVPDSFWDRVKRETEEELVALLLLIFIASATQHGASQNEATARALQFAKPTASSVADQWVKGGRSILETGAREWSEVKQQGGSVSRSDVLDRVAKVFGPNRVSRVTVTQTTNAATSGSDAGVASTVGLSDDDLWMNDPLSNVCPVCKPLHKKRRPVWSLKFPGGPPAHDGCNCSVVYAYELTGAKT